jgi:hypothetical protein
MVVAGVLLVLWSRAKQVQWAPELAVDSRV